MHQTLLPFSPQISLGSIHTQTKRTTLSTKIKPHIIHTPTDHSSSPLSLSTPFRRRIVGDEWRSTTDDGQAVVYGGGGVLIPRSIPVNNPAGSTSDLFRVWFGFRWVRV
ncbi:hypothetical protein HanOQP8_Chr12g0434661 [Helianthus annuus]|nr:hypothetical protein HanHA89_Chr12g0456481 [Helianthus annuus]KAJ0673887.1 hypothetical protein HanLR1_Chr12g0433921 [Helianthus annuus]KAJ0677242.1 hypothetical protein HanOQP8_Chr12g0434661 [Helianthus annuus]KAJ0861523.1 hypothetical protein HanPSC8_Chr12g0507651 [Helianthus annuus]